MEEVHGLSALLHNRGKWNRWEPDMAVKAPSIDADDPDREQECVVALTSTFKALTDKAQQAGWTREEIAFGLLELSRHEIRNLMPLAIQAPALDDDTELD